jgi:hypothetical protein
VQQLHPSIKNRAVMKSERQTKAGEAMKSVRFCSPFFNNLRTIRLRDYAKCIIACKEKSLTPNEERISSAPLKVPQQIAKSFQIYKLEIVQNKITRAHYRRKFRIKGEQIPLAKEMMINTSNKLRTEYQLKCELPKSNQKRCTLINDRSLF